MPIMTYEATMFEVDTNVESIVRSFTWFPTVMQFLKTEILSVIIRPLNTVLSLIYLSF